MTFNIGDKVQDITDPGKVGLIEEIGPIQGLFQYYGVFWGGVLGSVMVPGDSLHLYSASEKPGNNLIIGNLGGWQHFQRLITYYRLSQEQPLDNHLYAFNASRTKMFPYQFKPLLKFLDSPNQRLLIADEVGLGKTIEAGLILTEMRARQTVERVLVACPANLVSKWRFELKQRFGEDFRILKNSDMHQFLDEYTLRPATAGLLGIISLETLRNRNILERMESLLPDLDLVIVDEAHHLRNPGTFTHAAGEVLSRASLASGAMLLLTATPIQLNTGNLFVLLNLLDSDGFPDLTTAEERFRNNEKIVVAENCMSQFPPDIEEASASLLEASHSPWIAGDALHQKIMDDLAILQEGNHTEDERHRKIVEIQRDLSELNLLGHILNRTRKRQVQESINTRKARAIRMQFSPQEKEFYDTVTEFVRQEASRAGMHPVIVKWMINTPQRRMASCIPAMVDYYRTNMSFSESEYGEDFEYLDSDDNEAACEPERIRITRRLMQIIQRWDRTTPDTKYEKFTEILRGIRRESGGSKVMVFSFFKDTLKYLLKRLKEDGFGAALITGDVPPDERLKIIEDFRLQEKTEILLSSRVGSEGLDFQFCHIMVNYDLPWNPMEVEQRIGRLDRIGQASPLILIYNFWIENTIEERMLSRLYERIRIFEHSIGDMEAIVGEEIAELEQSLFSNTLTPEAEERLIEQKALALEARMQGLHILQQNAVKFMGVDQYFQNELATIQNNRRYVTAGQMRCFIKDFLEMYCPGTRILPDAGQQHVERLIPARDLEDLIREYQFSSAMTLFFQSGQRDGIPITFDSETAFENPGIEFINTIHPLVKIACKHLHNDTKRLVTASRFTLNSNELPSGRYFYFVYLLPIQAARPKNVLETVILSDDLEIACSSDVAERLLGEMVELGEECSRVFEEPEVAVLQDAVSNSEKYLLERVEEMNVEVKRHNDLLIGRQDASLHTSYSRKIKGVKELITRGEALGKEESYLRMPRGKLTKLEQQMAEKLEGLKKRRAVSIGYQPVAAGILEICQNSKLEGKNGGKTT